MRDGNQEYSRFFRGILRKAEVPVLYAERPDLFSLYAAAPQHLHFILFHPNRLAGAVGVYHSDSRAIVYLGKSEADRRCF